MTRRPRRGPSPALALAAVLVLVLLMCVGCAEQTQTVNGPAGKPTPGFDDAVYEESFGVLAKAGTFADGRWRYAVVLAVVPITDATDEFLVANGPNGETGYLSLCEDDRYDQAAWSRLDTLLDPGDLVMWATAGGDTRICVDEIKLVSKGAALPEATPSLR